MYGSWSWIWCWRKVLLIIFLYYVSLSPYRAFQQQQKSSLQFDMFGVFHFDNKSLARLGISNESFQNLFFPIFFFSCVWDIIIQSIAVALDEFVLDAIYPCGGCHAGHSRVCASLIDQEVAVLFDIPLLLELCVEKPTQRAKPSITYLYHQWRNLRYWFDRLWFCLGIVLWLTKLNHKYFRDQWASNFARRLSFIEWRIPFWERQECCQWLCVVYGNVSRCQSK